MFVANFMVFYVQKSRNDLFSYFFFLVSETSFFFLDTDVINLRMRKKAGVSDNKTGEETVWFLWSVVSNIKATVRQHFYRV